MQHRIRGAQIHRQQTDKRQHGIPRHLPQAQ